MRTHLIKTTSNNKNRPTNEKKCATHLLVHLKNTSTMFQHKWVHPSETSIQRTHKNYTIKNAEYSPDKEGY